MPDLTESDAPPPPDDLCGVGLALWDQVSDAVDLRPDESLLLAEAARTAMMLDRLRAELADAPLTVRGAQGQPVSNGLLGEARQYRLTLLRLLTSLGLPDPDEADGVTYASVTSIRASRAARSRWAGHTKRKDMRRGTHQAP